MAVEVTMPRFGLTMHEGTIQRFFKAAGERVSAGEPLYEVETEKVLYEVESPASGILALTLFEAGATVRCGGVVAVIAEPDEDLAPIRARYGAADVRAASAPDGAPASPSGAEAQPGARRAASPVARKLAAELGIELERVEGSGPGGRITREDVERAAAATVAGRPSVEMRAPVRRATAYRGMRRTIGERMAASLRESAQLTITTEADVTAAKESHDRLSGEFEFTYTDMLVQAVGRALLKHPRMNAHLEGEEIVVAGEVNVGVAVALEDGLIVPVVPAAASKSLKEIAALTRTLGEKARTGKLTLDEVSGGTFTITNLGTYGVDAFTPILNPGETGVLGVGRIVDKPAIHRGQVAARAMMTLSLTFDHRIIDGAPAAAFLATVVDLFNHGER
jgi:pyruvate dehydrogenase E2 component (dihydrolipoyllysine-residue acetyltransferase)